MISIAEEALAQLNFKPETNPRIEEVLAYARRCKSYAEFNEHIGFSDKMRRYGLTQAVKDITGFRPAWSESEEKVLLELREVKGLTFKQIGEKINRRPSAVQAKYRRLTNTNQ
jgi:hypothetical protein